MSIAYNKQTHRYYIQFYYNDFSMNKLVRKTITNSQWTKELGKKYMQKIEAFEIEKMKKLLDEKNSKYSGIMFSEIIEKYLTHNFNYLKFQTAKTKEFTIKNYVLNNFNVNVPIDKALNVESVENFKTFALNKGHTTSTINRIFRVLREIIDYANEREYINPTLANRMKLLLKNIKSHKVLKTDIVCWTNDEFNTFIDSFDESEYNWKIFFEVAYWGALRIGEIIGLKWKDFDFNNKTIFIQRTIDKTGNETTTKNTSSNATVDLPSNLCDELKSFKMDLLATNDDYIFFIKHTSRTSIKRKMEYHIKKAGVKYIKFHGLRHSMASRMINAGLNPLIVSKHLRHSSTQQTLDTYSHLFPNVCKNLMDNL